MKDLFKYILIALACPLVLPFIKEESDGDNTGIFKSNAYGGECISNDRRD